MDSFPVSCHNCYSHKRQFYVYLECKHFMCLSCSLCLADFQNLTIRCCYRNTKMSEQLASIMFDEVKSRNVLKNNEIGENSKINELSIFDIENKMQASQKAVFDQSVGQEPTEQKYVLGIDLASMGQSKVVNTFKLIDENLYKTTPQNQQKTPKQQYMHLPTKRSPTKNQPTIQFKQPQYQEPNPIQCPTFKQIIQPEPSIQNRRQSRPPQQKKENYVCWKNFDTTKDRILAKLTYHQQKMNSLIREHHY